MLYDTSGDEKLDMKEVGQLLRALGMTPTHLEVREIVREFDKDKNGVLSFKEFLDLYAKHKKPAAAAKELLEAFKARPLGVCRACLGLTHDNRCLTRRGRGPSRRRS